MPQGKKCHVSTLHETWAAYVKALSDALVDVPIVQDPDASESRGSWKVATFCGPTDHAAWATQYGWLAGTLASSIPGCGAIGAREIINALHPVRASLVGIVGIRYKVVDEKLVLSPYTKADQDRAVA